MGVGMTRTVILDGDIPIFQFAMLAEKPTDWGDGFWTLHAQEYEAKRDMDCWIDNIVETLDADKLIVALSHETNYRYEVLPSYKHNRSNKRQPMLRPVLKQYVEDTYDIYKKEGLEGDDILGILATHPTLIEGQKIMVSIDKDLKTIPGKHYRWSVQGSDIQYFDVDEDEADMFHLIQTLAGDSTDGYGGCPGIGMVVAERILRDEPHTMELEPYIVTRGKDKGKTSVKYEKVYNDSVTPWMTVCSYYEKAGLTETHALQQARVARICRSTDYNYKEKRVILWTP